MMSLVLIAPRSFKPMKEAKASAWLLEECPRPHVKVILSIP